MSVAITTDLPRRDHTPHKASAVRTVTDSADWDAAIWSLDRGNIFSAWPWGAYKERTGWSVRRLVIDDTDGEPLCFAQVQEKRRGFWRQIYIQGGPLLTSKGEKQAEATIGLFLNHLALRRFDLLAIEDERFGSSATALALLAQGFAPVVAAFNHTLELDLTQGYDAILKVADPQWRKDLRRAEKLDHVTVHFPTSLDDRLRSYDAFTALYAELKKRKGFDNSFNCAAYRDLAVTDPRHVFVEVRDRDEIVLVRIAHCSAERCTDFFAGASDKARASGAAVLSVSRLVERAIAQGCKVFDLGGVDPRNNRGVYEFKRKLSRRVVQTGPLWLYGRSTLLRKAAAAVLAAR